MTHAADLGVSLFLCSSEMELSSSGASWGRAV